MPHDPPRNNPADRLTEDLEALFERVAGWFAILRSIPRRHVETAIRTGSVLPITRSEHYQRATRVAIGRVGEIQVRLVTRGLRSGLREVGQSSVWARVPQIAEVRGAERAVDLIQAIDSQTRAGIRQLVRSAAGSYARSPSVQTLRDLADQIRPQIGLTPKQARLIRNRRAVKLARGVSPGAVRQEMKRQIGNMITARAKAIADRGVTEAIGFSRHQAFVEARDAGDLPAEVMKLAMDQADAAVRPLHRAQTEMGPIPLDEEFPLFGAMYPPWPGEHNCRCWHVLWNPEEMKSFRL